MVGRFLWGNFVCLDGSNRNLHQRLCDGFPETRNQKPGFPRASVVRNLPAVQETQETQVWSLGQEDPLDVGMATYFQYLCLGKSHGQRSLVGHGPWGYKKSDMIEGTEHRWRKPHENLNKHKICTRDFSMEYSYKSSVLCPLHHAYEFCDVPSCEA